MPFNLTIKDLVVILVLSFQATALAYVKSPKWKAIILSLPLPFTLMTWSSGRSIDVTTVLGVDVFFVFMQSVRILHRERRVPIIIAIAIATLGYCVIGAVIAAIVPRTPAAYWLATGATFALGLALYVRLPYRAEPGHRSSLPVWVKWPIITLIVLFLVASRGLLQGFATVFPIMGTMSSYEARHSLWTVSRQASVIMMLLAIMFIGPYLTQPYIGLIPSLVVGWLIWAPTFTLVTRYQWASVPAPILPAPSATQS